MASLTYAMVNHTLTVTQLRVHPAVGVRDA
jgi:hypothetical protein